MARTTASGWAIALAVAPGHPRHDGIGLGRPVNRLASSNRPLRGRGRPRGSSEDGQSVHRPVNLQLRACPSGVGGSGALWKLSIRL